MILRILSIFGVVFGIASIVSGGSVLFGTPDVAAAAGQTVGWIVWFNTLTGPVYVVAGLAILFRLGWAPALTYALAAAILVAGLGFAGHIAFGGGYEMRTVGAMILRVTLWAFIAYLVRTSAFETKRSLS